MVQAVDPSVANSPYVIYALMAVAVASIFFGAINRGTSGLGAWMRSLRRIGADAKAADIKSRDITIENLSRDLEVERASRQADRLRFQQELEARDILQDQRDDLIREHLQWDWKVYNVLVLAGLLNEDMKPPPLH
jgi:hypothetical protein